MGSTLPGGAQDLNTRVAGGDDLGADVQTNGGGGAAPGTVPSRESEAGSLLTRVNIREQASPFRVQYLFIFSKIYICALVAGHWDPGQGRLAGLGQPLSRSSSRRGKSRMNFYSDSFVAWSKYIHGVAVRLFSPAGRLGRQTS